MRHRAQVVLPPAPYLTPSYPLARGQRKQDRERGGWEEGTPILSSPRSTLGKALDGGDSGELEQLARQCVTCSTLPSGASSFS